jgi:hypothetical protein
MLLTLKRFGFNDSFVNWVKAMYTDIQTCVINNGCISEMLRNTRGTPLTALLFVLSVEIMALRIRNNKNIKGFQVKIDEINHSIKISRFKVNNIKSHSNESKAFLKSIKTRESSIL